jgi:hypothetical protein
MSRSVYMICHPCLDPGFGDVAPGPSHLQGRLQPEKNLRLARPGQEKMVLQWSEMVVFNVV